MPLSKDALKASREGYKLNIRKALTRVTAIYVNRDTTPPIDMDLRELHDRLKAYERELVSLDEKILERCDEDEMQDETVNNLDFREQVWKGYSEINALFDSIRPPTPQMAQPQPALQPQATVISSAASTSNTHRSLAVRLPKYELPHFDGDPLKYMEFWDIFEATVHTQPDLSDVEKLRYLKSALVGEAAKIGESYCLTNPMYQELVNKLKERFGKTDAAVAAHIEQLWNLPKARNSTASLRTTFDECDRHVRALSTLGYPETEFGKLLAPIILAKMPWSIKREANKVNKSKLWTMENLRIALCDEIEAREMADQSMDKGDEAPREPKPNQYHENHRQGQMQRGKPASASALANETKPGPVSYGAKSSAPTCVFCKGGHFSDECRKVSSVQERKKIAVSSRLCFNCLRSSHSVKDCRRAKPCFHCANTGHHSSLCSRRTPKSNQHSMLTSSEPKQDDTPSGTEDDPKPTETCYNLTATTGAPNSRNKRVYMQMAAVKLRAPDGKPVTARILFDSGSTCSYITQELQRKLKLKTTGYFSLANARFGDSTRQVKNFPCVSLALPTIKRGELIPLSLFVTARISCSIQKQPLDPRKYPILNKLELGDPITNSVESHEIDILIGGDHYYDIVQKHQIRLDDGLVLLSSRLGYIPSGCVRTDKSSDDGCLFVSCFLNGVSHESALHASSIERFWKLEDIGIRDDAVTPDDDKAVSQFENSVCDVDGRLTVGWPWKSEDCDLPENRDLAFGRFNRLIRRITPRKEVLTSYNAVIQDQLNHGIIEEVQDETKSDGRIHYLPHHEVVRADHSTTKLRVVYDGSAKRNKKDSSLNDCLLRGPVLLGDLCGLLLRFRLQPIAFTADIEKAYLQVGLHTKDRDVTRFFWLRDVEQSATTKNIVVYRFTRVLFGIISSAFLLDATIRYKMLNSGTSVATDIAQNTYVDNLAYGAMTESAAVGFYNEAMRLFGEISMNLRAWRTNSKVLEVAIPDDKRAKGTDAKVLGLLWDCESDQLGFQPPKVSEMAALTKRNLLQAGSKLFDPCGWLAPVCIKAKLLMQTLWKEKVKWDDEVSETVKDEWREIRKEIDQAARIRIPRYLDMPLNDFELHAFGDASAKVFAAAVYIRSTSPPHQTTLLMSKARLAPLKTVTIPRLELMAAVIGTRLLRFVKEQLKIAPVKCWLWSDSKCILHWLQSVKVLSVFVENRIKEIKQSGFECSYVPTDMNPADLPTKGTTAAELQASELWWNGPSFLRNGESHWPVGIPSREIEDDADTEVATLVVADAKPLEPKLMPFELNPDRYSALEALVNKVAWPYRFIANLRSLRAGKEPNRCKRLLPDEKRHAMLMCVRYAQKNGFSEQVQGKQWKNTKRQLGIFVDELGLLRCGGRMRHAELTDDAKFPILLPKEHPFTRLVVRHAHCEALHAGPAHTLSQLRTQFWIPHAMSLVKSVVHSCPWCRIWDRAEYKLPKIAPLPSFRVSRAPPFCNVGVDYFGPLYVRRHDAEEKVWILLFTCAVTRAIHLEVVTSMSTDQFLLGFRRLVANYGKPRKVVSDNAKQFKLAKTIMSESKNQLSDLDWKFIPAFSPWFGGFYERLVKTVKTALKKILGKQLVEISVLQTVICEVAALVNSRPLTLSTDAHDQILTPAHLLGKEAAVARMLDFQASYRAGSTHQDLVAMYNDRSKLLEMFWRLWRRDYLSNLRTSHGDHRSRPGTLSAVPKPGAVVLLRQETSRTTWPLGVVERVHQSSDGEVRSATVRLGTGALRVRPINKLIPLEAEMEGDDDSHRSPAKNSDIRVDCSDNVCSDVRIADDLADRAVKADDHVGRSANKSSDIHATDDRIGRAVANEESTDDSDLSSEF